MILALISLTVSTSILFKHLRLKFFFYFPPPSHPGLNYIRINILVLIMWNKLREKVYTDMNQKTLEPVASNILGKTISSQAMQMV